MSVKTKILLITTVLLVFATGTIYLVNRNVFLKDKESYLYSATLQNLDLESRGIMQEFHDVYSRLGTVLTFFNSSTQKFEDRLKALVTSQNWGRFFIYKDSVTGDFELVDSISDGTYTPNKELFPTFRTLKPGTPQVELNSQDPTRIVLLLRHGPYYIYSSISLRSIARTFQDRRFLVINTKLGQVLNPNILGATGDLQGKLLELSKTKKNAGVQELTSQNESYLISFKEIPQLSVTLFEINRTKEVYAVVRKTVFQTLLISLIVLSIGVLAMFFGIDQITRNLLKVAQEMEIFSKQGQAAKLNLKSKDEVGKIAGVFNSMLDKISALLLQTAEKSRMEAELETAKEVQMTLLPKSTLESELFSIRGFYQPASECGGDLWFYHHEGCKVLVFVADATGHGVSAALITSAARATLAVATSEKIWDPARILDLCNKTLCETSKGAKMMTAFAIVLDTQSNTLIYANASHEPPFLIPVKRDQKLTKNNLEFLTDATGKRLGQDLDTQYKASTHKMEKGQCLFLYTDGLTDAINAANEAFGERKMLKEAVDVANKQANSVYHDTLVKTVQGHIEKATQPDDITFVSVMLKDVSA